MAKQKFTLGRGLDALISTEALRTSGSSSIGEIEIDRIFANPNQPRRDFNEEALQELADSISELGVIQPITLRKMEDDTYQIIAGERRFRASQLAGKTSIPAYILNADDEDTMEMALIENIQREDLDAIEVALSFQRLIDECKLTQESMAEIVGKKRTTITNYLRLLKLPAEIQVSIRDKEITMGHAKAILSLPKPEAQKNLCEQILKKGLSVRQAEAKAQQLLKEKPAEEKTKPADNIPESYYKVAEIVGKYFDNNIRFKRNDKGKGSITINFNNDNEVESFLRAIEQIKN